MKYLRFMTKEEAEKALATINKNMGLPKKGVNAKTGEEVDAITKTFAELQLCDDGCYTMPVPKEDGAMKGVESYKEEDYSEEWFAKQREAEAKEQEEQARKDKIVEEVIAEKKPEIKSEVEKRVEAELNALKENLK